MMWYTFILVQNYFEVKTVVIQCKAICKCQSVTERGGLYIQQHCGKWQDKEVYFFPTCAGVSVSLIGCPSNLNLIWRIAKPCKTQDKHVLKIKHETDKELGEMLTCGYWLKNYRKGGSCVLTRQPSQLDYITLVVDPPVVRSMPSLTCWAECAFWFWTVRPTRLDPLL